MTQTLENVLNSFREENIHNRYQGNRFERLICNYLKTDPLYAELYSDVWLWSEYPDRGNKPDTGIDLVAKERGTGEYTAIQCKFYDPAHVLQKADIDSFFTASGKRPFTKRLIISTTDKWSKHAEDALTNQQIPVSRLRVQDLDESPVDWSRFTPEKPENITLKPKKKLRKHQEDALGQVRSGFEKASRGKLVMACGTGKTFTALKIAETMVPEGGNVLFLVPSISLISQTLTEWASESVRKMNRFVVCSDPKAGKKKDEEDINTHDLAFPAHTNPRLLAKQIKAIKEIEKKHITVVFSTYQSIEVVAEAQKLGAPEFDLVICDEAHRTTGVERLEHNEKEASAFIRIHDQAFIKAKKRLYMTATPRIYDDASKGKAKEADVELYSMDDPAVYGEEFYRLDFSEAVRRGLLSDYKVMVLAVDEKYVNKAFQLQLADQNNELNLDDVVKIVGCYNGLKKKTLRVDGDGGDTIDPSPMHRAVAFSRSIKDSKKIRDLFANIIKEYEPKVDSDSETPTDFLHCEVEHVDGKDNALVRNERLQWLKANTAGDGNVCRILSNARCLSEGVDVPALDAVMFLNPRNSVVDVVQSVGRVMRKVEGKQYGYIILPIGIPADVPPEVALADNQKYKIVWQVLQALRAHDDRFNAVINQLDINKRRPDQIQIIGVSGETKEGTNGNDPIAIQTTFSFPHLEDWENAIFAKIVVKCGSRRYWESWAQDVAKIAERHIHRIKALLESSDAEYRNKFDKFLGGLRKNLNPSISEDDAIEMLSQHLITKPVFDALFENYEFTKHNPVSKTMQRMLDLLEKQSLEKETTALEKFYESVRERARGVDNAEGKQRIIIELYDKFFKAAFPRMAERLGIVYTPIEVIDFIIRSADDILRQEFGVSLTDKDVHILDPFTGTGTFIVRLIQSGIIKDADLERKYKDELHANELILLAYYIAAINIEEAFHGRTNKAYEPFEGIVLTDTFQLTEGKGLLEEQMFPDNNKRSRNQQAVDIRVIVGNPPYSVGQGSQNDDNQNLNYPHLNSRIESTYAARSDASNKRNLYDSYIRAIRWASDRINDKGIVCFITNGRFIDAGFADGMRKCIADEFTDIYVFNLRGFVKGRVGDDAKKEGGNIFNILTGVAITLLVKNPDKRGDGRIHYFDVGDYVSREEKLQKIRNVGSVSGLNWRLVTPNEQADWINVRDPAFAKFMAMTHGAGRGIGLFSEWSNGLLTARDAWAYNFSKPAVAKSIRSLILAYNNEVARYQRLVAGKPKDEWPDPERVVDKDPKKISWSSSLLPNVARGRKANFNAQMIVPALYRPYQKEWLYFDALMNHRVAQWPKLFPHAGAENLIIVTTAIGARREFSALITNSIPNYHLQDTGQCFPLYCFDEAPQDDLFGKAGEDRFVRRDAITDDAIRAYRKTYADDGIGKEDLFYYVYGLFHSPEYKTRFEADLKKQLPRTPFATDFWAFSKAGRELARWHLNYETVDPWPLQATGELDLGDATHYRVQKMVWAKNRVDGRLTDDKTTLIYNSRITLGGVPPEALEYVVNGKPAIEWVMERYQVTTDKDSGITNDPNDWAKEHDDPKYILNLVKRIITVSIETMKIVKSLPPLNGRNQ